MKHSIQNIALTGVFAALSIVLVMFIHLPLFPAVPFLEYDPADIPIYMITALLGPWYGLGMTLVVSIIQGLTVSAVSGWVGILMHIFATGSFVAAESLVLYLIRKRHGSPVLSYSVAQTVAAMAAGVIAMTAVMALWNLFLTPYFMGLPLNAVLTLYPYIIAFNLVKALINGAVAFILYKSLRPVLGRVTG